MLDELAERDRRRDQQRRRVPGGAAGDRARRELGANEIEIVNDSELVARQLTGAYKVKHPSMKPLYLEAIGALRTFDRWRIRTVPRAENARADELVNAALDGTAV